MGLRLLDAFSYQKYKHPLHIGVSHTMDRQCGTVCQQHCGTVVCYTGHIQAATKNSYNYLRLKHHPTLLRRFCESGTVI